MEAVPTAILGLPTFDDDHETRLFFEALTSQYKDRHGIKSLMHHCNQIVRYKRLYLEAIESACDTLKVVNGKRTALQLQKDHERGQRNTARRFYESLTIQQLIAYTHQLGLSCSVSLNHYDAIEGKAQLIDELIAHFMTL